VVAEVAEVVLYMANVMLLEQEELVVAEQVLQVL
jgi:hypothetical protein